MGSAARAVFFLVIVLSSSLQPIYAASPLPNLPLHDGPRMLLQLRDGTSVDASALFESAPDAYIVEFNATPAILMHGPALQTRASGTLFDRLEHDLTRLSGFAKTSDATAPRITRRFRLAFSGAGVHIPASMVKDVARLDYVRRVVPDRIVRALQTDPVTSIGAPEVWSTYGIRGRGVVVAVIDTGVDYRHPALGGGFGPGFKVAGGYDFVNEDSDPLDDAGHGTHVAGIIAADLPGALGVAPDATLLAYKVLSSRGEGTAADVIAAIERTVDPNEDGDPADAVDVVNLSLGVSYGVPDDPVTVAVENASRAGILFCIAAGNDGRAFSIGAPGNAPSALTVGAAGLDGTIAPFSSRGPTRDDLLVKPEVVAPGVNIRSTFPDGGYATLSGTSMAAPHVAGVAALLRSVHPEWSGEEIKSAIIASARRLGTEVTTEGAGYLDAPAAARSPLFASPGTLTFARDPGAPVSWSAVRTLRIANRSVARAELALDSDALPSGLSMTIEPSAVILEPGESREIRVTLDARNDTLRSPDGESLSYGGSITVRGTGEAYRIPWNLVKAIAVTLHLDASAPAPALTFVAGRKSYFQSLVGFERDESALIGGDRFVLTSITDEDPGNSPPRWTFQSGTADVDQTIVIRAFDAVHTITMRSTDENGRELDDRDAIRGRWEYGTGSFIQWPQDYALRNLLSYSGVNQIRISDAPPEFKFNFFELRFDPARGAAYLIQHPGTDGITASATLARTSADLVSREVEIQFPDLAPQPRLIISHTLNFVGEPERPGMISAWMNSEVPRSTTWKGRLFLSSGELTDPDYSLGIGILGITGRPDPATPDIQFFAQPLKVNDGVVASFISRTPDPTTWIGDGTDPLRFGGLPVIARERWSVTDRTFSLTLSPAGPLVELRANDLAATPTCTLFDDRGERIADCTASSPFTPPAVNPLPAAGRYLVQVRMPVISTAFDSSLLLNDSFDTRLQDMTPPVLTSAQVVSGGRLAGAYVPLGSNARLRFSGIDCETNDGTVTYDLPAAGATTAAYRRTGTEAWTAVPVETLGTEIGDAGELGHRPTGTSYEAGLSAAAATPGGVDLRIRIEDRSGNAAEWILSPAFQVTAPRPRAARP